jgi:uncharacterized protein (TIGR02186 family)
MTARAALSCLLALLAVAGARPALAETAPREHIEIGLSADKIAITSAFRGADLTIFGALDNADPQLMREGRYDVIVVLEGPPRRVVVRRKDRVLGMWINTQSETFKNVPVTYSVALTRPPQDIASAATYRQLALGINYVYLEPDDRTASPATIAEFTAELRERKRAESLYSERVGGVQFLSSTLFRATVALPPDVPVGTHNARAFLFRSGVFLTQTSAPLVIVKSDFEQSIYVAAHRHGFLYGLAAVLLAVATGWAGRLAFRRD